MATRGLPRGAGAVCHRLRENTDQRKHDRVDSRGQGVDVAQPVALRHVAAGVHLYVSMSRFTSGAEHGG